MRRISTLAAIGLLGTLLAACSSGASSRSAPLSRSSTTQAAGNVTSTTDDTTPETTTTSKPPKVHPPGMVQGDSGPKVQALQERLAALHYDVGTDGRYGGATYQAVMAFQKVTGMKRTGNATDDVVAALATATPPNPLVPGGGATRVEVDIARQVLFLYRGNQLDKIVAISTGHGKHYCENGECGTAVTPGGSFRVSRRIPGWHTSPLGKLFNPMFFNGGIAIHGAPSVPAYPASHGCVRIPMTTAGWFYATVPNGTPVYVVGGPNAPAPPLLVDQSTTSTSTTANPTTSTSSSTTSTTQPTTTTSSSTTTTALPTP
jgi:lipoprotein-anchoring transpeptidase ErfK/SrfK